MMVNKTKAKARVRALRELEVGKEMREKELPAESQYVWTSNCYLVDWQL